jgi:hypothetical protein
MAAVRWKASHNVAGRSDVLMILNLGTHTVQMDDSPESDQPRERVVRRAEQLAVDAEKHVPSWLRAGDPESALPVLVALLSAMALQVAIPKSYTLVPRWPLLCWRAAVRLLGINPSSCRAERGWAYATGVLLTAITVDNTLSAVLLDARIISGEVSNKAAVLLGSGAAIFVTNIIVFGIWYWELDRGGPFARHAGERPYPDFMFPQMATPNVAKPDRRPTFVDYLYVSVTNVMAFSLPTPCRWRAGTRR